MEHMGNDTNDKPKSLTFLDRAPPNAHLTSPNAPDLDMSSSEAVMGTTKVSELSQDVFLSYD